MQDVNLTVRLTVVGPVLTRASVGGEIGVDATMMQQDGEPCLPYSLIKGRLRQAWAELEEAAPGFLPPADRDAWLGPPPLRPGTASLEPQRGRLRFSDFRMEPCERNPRLTHRIAMDPGRGAARQGFLLTMHSPLKAGQEATFSGQVSFRTTPDLAQQIQRKVMQGLRWITSFGAERTIGFGWLKQVQITAHTVAIVTPAPAPVTGALGLEVTFTDSVCVAKRRLAYNLFESDEVLSGAVLKGALATMIQDLPEMAPLRAHLEKLRISHAFPAPQGAGRRPVVAPLSLIKAVVDGEVQVFDVALCEGPCLLGRPHRAPAFAVDWKDDGDVRATYGWGQVGREVRVHTALDRESRRARDEQLFAYEMLVPHQITYHARVDLHEAPPAAVAALHAVLAGGLFPIGKSKARAEVRLGEPAPPAQKSNVNPLPGGVWVVTLQTPMLLCDRDLDYAKVFSQMSGGAVKLVRFFAQQSLWGGYLAYRFRPDAPYNPYLMTDAGSVFVLQQAGEGAQAFIQSALSHGLPMPQWVRERHGTGYQTNPFLSACGFGEIAVNLPCHQRPAKELCHVL